MLCPRKHKLPNVTPTGQCTPLYCGAESKIGARHKKVEKQKLKKRGSPVLAPREEQAPEDEAPLAVTPLSGALERKALRDQFLGTPQNLSKGESEKWADEKLVTLLPTAVAELEFQLKLGDDDMRARAAKSILDATGRGKREVATSSQAPMIIQFMASPWAQPKPEPKTFGPKKPELTEGEVISE